MRDIIILLICGCLGYMAYLSYERQGAVYTLLNEAADGMSDLQRSIDTETPQARYMRCYQEALEAAAAREEPNAECVQVLRDTPITDVLK